MFLIAQILLLLQPQKIEIAGLIRDVASSYAISYGRQAAGLPGEALRSSAKSKSERKNFEKGKLDRDVAQPG